jgi:hypothetical protein
VALFLFVSPPYERHGEVVKKSLALVDDD